jgi:hypothetical protein
LLLWDWDLFYSVNSVNIVSVFTVVYVYNKDGGCVFCIISSIWKSGSRAKSER